MNRKTIIVTGATGKIGYAIARLMAKKAGYRIFMVGRNEESLNLKRQELISHTGNSEIEYCVVDLSLKEDIYNCAKRWSGPLHILINNAATCPRKREENTDGIELQFATNVLGYYRMIKAFESILKNSGPARVINVASYWAGDLDINDLEFKHREYDNNTAYRQSKQADRMLTTAFADIFQSSGITVNACHPGDVNSKLSNSLGFGGHESPEQGAATPVWLASSTEVEGISGKYFEHQKETVCSFGKDKAAANALIKVLCNTL
jgi:retinol dehydrogenase-13